MTKISHVSWGGYDKGFYGIWFQCSLWAIPTMKSLSVDTLEQYAYVSLEKKSWVLLF